MYKHSHVHIYTWKKATGLQVHQEQEFFPGHPLFKYRSIKEVELK